MTDFWRPAWCATVGSGTLDGEGLRDQLCLARAYVQAQGR